MQSTNARDKRGDNRRDCSLRVTIREVGLPEYFPAVARNHSRGGVLVELARPLWPGMEFSIRPAEDATEVAEWAEEIAAVRWCTVYRRADCTTAYRAGLQFRPPLPALRSVPRFTVIVGGASSRGSIATPSRAIRAAAQPSEGRAAEVHAARMACSCIRGGIRAMDETEGHAR